MSKAEERLMEKSYSIGYNNGYMKAKKDLGWHSVEESLPKEEGIYLVHIFEWGYESAEWDIEKNRFHRCGEDCFGVDYWMPCPKIPKEEEQ